MSKKLPYYNDYLEVSKLINLGHLATEEHDEQLFMTIHQAYEIWFKQILFELKSVVFLFVDEKTAKPRRIDDNSGEMVKIVSRLSRIVEIWKVLVAQIDILETMTPMDFLEFRKSLTPASGFQSRQFRLIEALMGLTPDHRYKSTESVDKGAGHDYYKKVGAEAGGFDQSDRAEIDLMESGCSLRKGVIAWLDRFSQSFGFTEKRYNDMWQDYLNEYLASLPEHDQDHLSREFSSNFLEDAPNAGENSFGKASRRAALIISLLRDYPVLRAPFQVITRLIEIDEQMAIWRFRHLNMTLRMIGKRSGTGGHSSKYLEGAVRDNRVFPELLELPTYMLDTSSVDKIIKPIQTVLQGEFTLKKQL
ncbi:MAG: tryptophan 2,3-dioxygenase [Candidatus Obscuribacterales bacterium]|nr:tryptophan 2,3-dioxygenase [Candidatus Obscuribacterales bacterium]